MNRRETSILANNKSLLTGTRLLNYCNEQVPRLPGPPRWGIVPTEIVIHETVTRDQKTAIAVLRKRRLGVHFIIDPVGLVTQHADVVIDAVNHASKHNLHSIGIEVVNPYYPKYLKNDLLWSTVIQAPWAHKKLYVVPTRAQAEALYILIGDLTSQIPTIPRDWIGLNAKKQVAMGRVVHAEQPRPGIYAHTYFGHADGSWLVLYCLLRAGACLSPEHAYLAAVARASGARASVDLSDVL